MNPPRGTGFVLAGVLASATVHAEPEPVARGVAWSFTGGAGISHSSFSTALALNELGELGGYVYGSESHAIALEVVEQMQLVVDRTTPEYGFAGVGFRHVSRPSSALLGAPHTAVFQRLAIGPAYVFDGNRFELGVGGAVSLGYMLWGRSGLALDLSVDVYRMSPLARNTLAMLSVGYVISPLVDVPRHQPVQWQPEPPAHPGSEACDVPGDEAQLRAHRKTFVTVCPQQPDACAHERAAIDALDAKLRACAATGAHHAP